MFLLIFNRLKIFICTSSVYPTVANSIFYPMCYVTAGCPIKSVDEPNYYSNHYSSEEHSSNIKENPGHSARKDICFNDEFWNSVEAEIGPERKNIVVSFPNNLKNEGVKTAYIKAIPSNTYMYESFSNAFHMH